MYKFIYIIIAGLLFAGSTAAIINGLNQKSFHPQNTGCQQCHLARDEITAKNASKLISTQEKLCSSCHENALKVSHPSGFNPERAIPDKFPLDWKNEITCSTCHNVHENEHGSIRGDTSGKEFCLSCHKMSFFDAMVDHGLSIQQNAHMGIKRNNYSTVDAYSIECMSCHANQGDTIDVTINSRGIVKHSSGSVNHPIGMLYANAKGAYKPVAQISGNIILPEGKVSCISCHKGYSKKHGESVNKISKTALCLECHDM